MLPFTRETPDRLWLGFVDEAEAKSASVLATRVLPVLVIASIAALVASGGKRSKEPEAAPPSSAAAARMQVAAAGHERSPQNDASAAAPVVPVPPEPKTEPKPEPASAEEEAESEVQANPAPQQPPVKAQPKPRPKVVREPTPLSPAAARRAARAARGLRPALADGRVVASRENFALVNEDDGELGWEDAKSSCASLQVEGVGGWLLPTRGQAREIHRGKAAPRSAYWTRQRGPHGDTIYVYDPRTRRAAPWLDQEIASVVCVQPRPR